MRILVLVVPDEFSSAKHVEVQMFYLLSAVITVVRDEPVAGFIYTDFCGNFLNEGGHICHHFR